MREGRQFNRRIHHPHARLKGLRGTRFRETARIGHENLIARFRSIKDIREMVRPPERNVVYREKEITGTNTLLQGIASRINVANEESARRQSLREPQVLVAVQTGVFDTQISYAPLLETSQVLGREMSLE